MPSGEGGIDSLNSYWYMREKPENLVANIPLPVCKSLERLLVTNQKNTITYPERTSKLQKKPSALKREHPSLQNMTFLTFSTFVVHFCPPGSESGAETMYLGTEFCFVDV